MPVSKVHQEVNELNYAILVQFREFYASAPSEAMLRYNVDLPDANKILALTHEELRTVACTGRLLFTPEFTL